MRASAGSVDNGGRTRLVHDVIGVVCSRSACLSAGNNNGSVQKLGPTLLLREDFLLSSAVF